MKKMWIAVIFMFVCSLAISGLACAQSYDSESASESSMASSLDSKISSEESDSEKEVSQVDSSMHGNETATETF